MNMRRRRKHCANILAKEFGTTPYKPYGWKWQTIIIGRKCLRALMPA